MRVVALKDMFDEIRSKKVPWGTYGTCSESFEYCGQRYIMVHFDNDAFLAFGTADHPLVPYKGWIRIVED